MFWIWSALVGCAGGGSTPLIKPIAAPGSARMMAATAARARTSAARKGRLLRGELGESDTNDTSVHWTLRGHGDRCRRGPHARTVCARKHETRRLRARGNWVTLTRRTGVCQQSKGSFHASQALL